jgi:hypothetical protein
MITSALKMFDFKELFIYFYNFTNTISKFTFDA